MTITDEYWYAPQGTYAERRRAFLTYAAAAPGGRGRTGFFSQTARLVLGRGPLDAESISDALTFVDTRQDCADFTVAGLLRILYQFGANPLLDADLRAAIERSLLGFKYWIDEPGRELMCFWSENHQIMFHAAEYLAGQLFPDDVFTNSGTRGREHMASARSRILRWIALKARVGFAEWDSNTYYDEDMTPLLNLADFASDSEVARQAVMLLDVMFFDMAVDSFRGVYGTSHGRSYPHNVLDARTSAMTSVQKIAWGMGVFNNPNSMTAVSLAASPRYRVPPIIEAIAQDVPAVLINRERHSLRIEECARYGINIDDPDGLMLLWGAGLFAERRTADATLALADRHRSHRFSVVIRPYAEAVRATYAELARQSIPNDGDLDRTTMTQVDKITYRTPDYQLSCALDYRKGKPGFQQHIWQATLGPDAIVFTMHRGNEDEQSYKYWVGRFPRAAQHNNLLIAIYDIPERPLPGPTTIVPPEAGGNAMPSPAPSEEELLPYTVAIFRRAVFDEVIEQAGWIFGRKDRGYIALRSQQPVRWTADGVLRGEGLIADGRRNVWICQLGCAVDDGQFAAWAARIAAAPLAWNDRAVRYDAPGIGRAEFAWEGPLTVDGHPIRLGDHGRFENPYCFSEHGCGRYEIAFRQHRLIIDFPAGMRQEHAHELGACEG
jgi:hypothetical protein